MYNTDTLSIMMIERALERDLPEILQLQRSAFSEEANFVGDPNIHPMSQTLEELRLDFAEEVMLKYVEKGTILGSVRAKQEGDTCHIKRMVVHPDHWGKGIGKALMKEIENTFSDARRYELFTRIDHERTRPFYRNLGYVPFKTEKVSDTLTFVYLEKQA
jgi:GNAT superfamily N-acetyltransferase